MELLYYYQHVATSIVIIIMITPWVQVEAGVDGGGLFKDFMENLIQQGFNPQVRHTACLSGQLGSNDVSWKQ